ncbi:TPA: hypothetical protein QCX06_004184 [Bacillus paranthracis]|uniref:hypothetical protein n=1 Tax=Bacillus paranthracis TaxID=2026186 RepID=UPI00298CE919|nr:hypothetical protein [Bacillus paranthracis]HDR7276602.1 hypothetical protein [Bacillus paranthracis]HDR7306532.1 hypothetical protein [Bacillus paranthracis]
MHKLIRCGTLLVFKVTEKKFAHTYTFVLQITMFIDADLHQLYMYLNYLLRKLPCSSKYKDIYMTADIVLQYY